MRTAPRGSDVRRLAAVEALLEAAAQVLARQPGQQPRALHRLPRDLDPSLHVHVDAARLVEARVTRPLVELGDTRAAPKQAGKAREQAHVRVLPPEGKLGL